MRLYDEHTLSETLTNPLKREVEFNIEVEEALLDKLLADEEADET